MLRIVQLEEIQNLLLPTPRFVDLLEAKDADVLPELKAWLKKIEGALQNNRMPVVSMVAGLHGALVSAENGVLLESIVIHGRLTARKIKLSVAADVMKRAAEVVMNAIEGDKLRISKAAEICQQVVALAKAKNLVIAPQNGMGHTERLKAIWSAISSDPEIATGALNIEGLVGASDSLVLLDRALVNGSPAG